MNIEIIGVTASHVDDLIYIGTNEFSKLVIDVLMQVFKVSKHEVENFVFTGWTLKQSKEGIILSQQDYLQNLDMNKYLDLARCQGTAETTAPDNIQDLFRSLNGVLGWIAQVSHPTLSYHFIHYSTKLGKATAKDARGIYKLVLKSQKQSH